MLRNRIFKALLITRHMLCARCGKTAKSGHCPLCLPERVERKARRTLAAANLKKYCTVCIVNNGTAAGVVTAFIAKKIITTTVKITEQRRVPSKRYDVILAPGSADTIAASFLAVVLGETKNEPPVTNLLENVTQEEIRWYAEIKRLIYRQQESTDDARQLVDALEHHSPGTIFGLKNSAKKLQWQR
jgi:hypothetical protein